LIEEPWALTQSGSLPRLLQDDVFKAASLEVPTAKVLTISLHLYTRLVETGRWLGLVPGSVMRFGAKRMSIKVLPVKVLSPSRPVGFVTIKDRTLTPLAERFIDCARKVTKADKLLRN
jgi:DNA-binding transcriptional LysR family regulator